MIAGLPTVKGGDTQRRFYVGIKKFFVSYHDEKSAG
jgi:hypothetical protein